MSHDVYRSGVLMKTWTLREARYTGSEKTALFNVTVLCGVGLSKYRGIPSGSTDD